MGSRYPQPDNEDAFEQMCLRFYRNFWKNENLTLYAKRGEKQYGIDVHDPACLKPIRAVQCKHHEATKTLPPAEIKEEVRKAETWPFPLDTYVIATTAKKSRNAQDTVTHLNSRPDSEKKFTVQLHFWEDICDHLGQFTRILAEFIVAGHDIGADLVATILQDAHIASVVSRLLASEEIPAGAFSEIEQLLNDRTFDAARHELDKLPDSETLAKLSNEDQYTLLRLRAKLALETGQFEMASSLFLAACEKQPDLDQAKQNQVLAYALIHETGRAFALASHYVTAEVVTPVMLGRLIENASTREQIGQHSSLIAPYLSSDEGINLALCHKLLHLGDRAGATDAAGRALTIAPDSPHAHFAAALPAHNAAVKGDWRERKAHLECALAHYDAAAKGARQKNYPHLLPEILINRAAAHMLLGDTAAATADYRAAVAAATTPAAYAACAVSFFLHEQEFATAWEMLESVDGSTVEGRFLTAITEFHNTENEEERRRYLKELRQLGDESWPRAVESRLYCVSEALLLKDPAFARSCITDTFQASSPFQAFTALAWIAVECGDGAVALAHAEKALEHNVHGAHRQELRLLADVFTQLNAHAKALNLLERVAIPGLFDDDTKRLVTCATRLQRHDLLLRICRELRETDQQDDGLRRMELQLLNRYAPNKDSHSLTHSSRVASRQPTLSLLKTCWRFALTGTSFSGWTRRSFHLPRSCRQRTDVSSPGRTRPLEGSTTPSGFSMHSYDCISMTSSPTVSLCSSS